MRAEHKELKELRAELISLRASSASAAETSLADPAATVRAAVRATAAEAEAEVLRQRLEESETATLAASLRAADAEKARSAADAAAAADAKEAAKAKQAVAAAERRLAVMQSMEAASAKEAEGKDAVSQREHDKAVARAGAAEAGAYTRPLSSSA